MSLPLGLLKGRFCQSFQCKMMLLLVILLVPIFIIQVYVYYDRYQARLSEELQANMELARAVAATFEAFLQDVLNQEAIIGFGLTSLRLTPDERDALLARSLKEYPSVWGFAWIDPRGIFVAATNADVVGMDASQRRYIREITVEGRDWSVSELVVSLRNQIPAFAIARAVRKENGELLGIVVTLVVAEKLDRVLGIERSRGAAINVVDNRGMLVFRYPDPKLTWEERERASKRSASHGIPDGEERAWVGESALGDRRVMASAPIRSIGWRAGAGRAESEAMAETRAALLPQALLFSVITLTAFGSALFFSRRICNSLNELREYVRSLGDAASPPLPSLPAATEIRELREAFEEMTGKLRARDSALRESEEQLRLFIEHAPVSLAMFDRDMKYLCASRRWLRDHASEDRDMRGLSYYETFPGVPESWKTAHRRALAGEVVKADEDCLDSLGGVMKWVRWEVRPWRKESEVAGIIVFCEDISERREAAEKLRASEEQFRTLVENAPDAIYIQSEACFAYVNDATVNLYGADSTEDLLGKPILDRIHPDSRPYVAERIRASFEQEIPGAISEQKHLKMDGQTIIVEAHSASIRYRNRSGALIFVRDITERKRAREEKQQLQERLQQALKAESLGRMAGGIAHHFNNMLGAAMGYLELVLYELPKDSPFRANIAGSIAASQRAAEICRLMLSYLGQTTGKKESHEFHDICREAIELLAASLPVKIRLEWQPSGQPLLVNVNESDIKQVLTNLVMNASEAIGDSEGTITVESHVTGAAEIREAMFFPLDWKPLAGEYVCLSVSDTGRGLDSDAMDKIFDPFFSTKFTGRGLGLPTALGLVRSHDGAITVESRPGRGAIFRVFLPLPDRETEQPGQEVTAMLVKSGGMVLMAEDDPMVRDMARAMLKRLGYDVLAAADGIEARELFEPRKNEFCLAFLDVSMPRMDGWELMAVLRRLRPDMPVILASGHNEMPVREEACAGSPDAFVHKPYTLDELNTTILSVRTKEADRDTAGENGAKVPARNTSSPSEDSCAPPLIPSESPHLLPGSDKKQ